ncbi:MAG: hypothetical protein IPP64_01390 [Bacteroidetes bacterium]|nr:hypothetical protein [Bacteroidota bacterium]
MKVTKANFGNISRVAIFKALAVVFFFTGSSIQLFAQETDSALTDSATTEAVAGSTGDGPSIENITKNLASSAKELEKIRKEEIMSYIYMGLGFSIVIAIAWFTTILARKRKRKEDEIRAIRAQNMKHHKPHHPHHPKR